jgi:hypothetical protein
MFHEPPPALAPPPVAPAGMFANASLISPSEPSATAEAKGMVTPAGLDSFVADAIHFTVQRYFRELLEDPTGPITTAWAITSLQAPTSTGATTDTERGAMTVGACNGWEPVPDADDRGAWRASGRSVTTSFTAICAPCPRVIKAAVHPLHAHARPS